MRTTSGRERASRGPPRCRSPPHRRPRSRRWTRAASATRPEHRVVVGDEHPMLRRPAVSLTPGPAPAARRRRRPEPPSRCPRPSFGRRARAARSRIDASPTPARRVGDARPSSATVTRDFRVRQISTRQRRASACRTDVGHRLRRDPVGRDLDRGRQGRSGSGPNTSKVCRSSESRLARCRIAPMRPTSSRAGGRSS